MDEVKKVRKYFLSCLVKTSHHIKGVCFIDDKKLNFKVFLNQRTGSAMSGVEVGFTNKDDDLINQEKLALDLILFVIQKIKICIKFQLIIVI